MQIIRQGIPEIWTTENLVITDSVPDELDDLHEVLCSNSRLAEVDETFKKTEKPELLGLIECGTKREWCGDYFQMQTIRLRGDNKIAGYFHFVLNKPQEKDIYISIFVINSKHQNKKIGRELVCNFLKLKTGFERVALRVYIKNLKALNFWISLGFKQIRRLDLGNNDNVSLILSQDLKGAS